MQIFEYLNDTNYIEFYFAFSGICSIKNFNISNSRIKFEIRSIIVEIFEVLRTSQTSNNNNNNLYSREKYFILYKEKKNINKAEHSKIKREITGNNKLKK